MLKQSLVTISLVCLSFCTLLIAEHKDKSSKKRQDGKNDELTLEKLFPEKSFFGPSARFMEFSFDGKYAAYLYRPYKERRHGSDLWIYDVAKDESRRITSASVMSRFQKSTRKVKGDRIKKAKEADRKRKAEEKKKKKDGGKNKQKQKELKRLKKRGDWVSDEDAEDKEAPRYSGIKSFEWSPKANELLFVSERDIYRWKVGRKKPKRLTRTRDSERRIAWLPDASGYMYMHADDFIRVRFGSHRRARPRRRREETYPISKV